MMIFLIRISLIFMRYEIVHLYLFISFLYLETLFTQLILDTKKYCLSRKLSKLSKYVYFNTDNDDTIE